MDLLVGFIVGIFTTLLVTRLFEYLFMTRYWLRAMLSGTNLSLVAIIRMRTKGCPVPMIVDTYCALVHSGHDVSVREIEAYYITNRFDSDIDDPQRFLNQVKNALDQRSDSDNDEDTGESQRPTLRNTSAGTTGSN